MKKRFTRLLGCISMLLIIAFVIPVRAQKTGNKITVEAALNAISKKYNTKFAYEHDIVQGKTTTSESLKAKNLDEALKQVLYPHDLLFLYVSDGNYTIVTRDERLFPPKNSPVAQAGDNDIFISGKVIDETGNPLPGASIKGNGSNAVTATDVNGRFTARIQRGTTLLGFSYLGYEHYNYQVNGSQNNLIITLKNGAVGQLSEVNVVSTGLQKLSKERSTGSAEVVTAAQLEKIQVPNVLQRLESMVPGVKINITSGDNSFVYGNKRNAINGGTRTRGASDYSFFVRGKTTVSSVSETLPLIVVDGAITENDISSINPNDIANITFLKDAAAASIWGTRAANGVVVITTKTGKPGQAPVINFSVNASVSNQPDLGYLKTMTSAQAIAYEQELVNKNIIVAPSSTIPYSSSVADVTDLTFKLKAGTITQSAYNSLIAQYSSRDSKSQIERYLLQPATSQTYNLSISGGNNFSSYFYSASYSKEDPYSKGNSGDRLTVTLNNTFKLLKIATLTTNLKGSFFNYKSNGISLNSLYSPNRATFMPYNQLVDDNGNRVSYSKNYYTGWLNTLYPSGFLNWGYNALDEIDHTDNTQRDNNYSANFNLNVPIVKGLSANAFYNTERSFTTVRNYNDEASYSYRNYVNGFTPIPTTGKAINSLGLSSGGGGIYTVGNATTNNYTLRGQLNYETTLGADHQINAIAGSEIRQTKQGDGSSTLYGYNMSTGLSRPVNFFNGYTDFFNSISGLAGAPSQQDKTRRYLSYYSNAAYTYKSKYTLSGSVRYDDYNNFGVDRSFRATPLYSFGGKWDAAKESFLNQVKWISNLSVRATYGVNGNISTSTYPFTWISLGGVDPSTGLSTASILAPANPELRWEKTYVTNIGVDFSFLNNNIYGSVDIYRKHGTDLLYNFPISGTYGFTSLLRNTTELTGKGIDLSLGGVFYKTEDWDLNGRLTYAYNTNEVNDTRFVANSAFFSSPAYGSIISGYNTDKLLVYRNAGLDATGMTLIYDQNGNKIAPNVNLTSIDALAYAGRTTAPHFGSYTQSVRYKDFTLMAVATYQFGNVFLRPTITSYPSSRAGVAYDLSADVARRWQKAGDEATTNVPGVAGTFAAVSLTRYAQSDINVLKGDYIRLRELSLTYKIPVEHLTRMVKTANFAFAVRNLGLLWTANKEGIDPDFTSGLNSTTLGLPATVSYNFTLNVNF
ncbi:TonB-linked SusC/RagA family outer membrane protein [Pedobacter psychrotolerans]|uniref:SusC/RagA family TonB-linked outer membrane protein n=1 Tax=Pedobacter psychrotolerans TaxID=1843235 RepID=A0A4R2HM36_9SPHI|nr:SusC/RagA family TonB-linked outer membrane protein [Pedobacter psychrotolerans]TCO28835.1 TonB-linked SusC/RagA family outer membrane protein [Pedobacter psychrotolerans]GGE52132.1 SusC/RagA family TonB-linked outer membrane protein [Pedobacter psychrotolerans]